MFAQKITTKGKKKKRFNKITLALIKGMKDDNETLNKLSLINPDAYCIAKNIRDWSFASLYQNSRCEYFKYGELGFPKMIEELKKAKKFIFFEYFIIESGEFFDSIYEILVEKAKQGLDVRMIYDDFGSVNNVHTYFYKEVRKNGIKCFSFNRIRPAVDIRQNSRDHRKILVIDGKVGFTGGCNIADEYINKINRFGVWHDNILMLKGEAVNGLTNTFLSNWCLNNKKNNDDEVKDYLNSSLDDNDLQLLNDNGFYQPFGEVPFDGNDGTKNAYLGIISRAKKYIYISTPYLILDSEIITALQNASKGGVDVRIVTPGIPDKKIVYSVTRSYYAELLVAGVKIYEYTPGFNHAKIIVSDDTMAMTGTANLDYRSLYLHFENMVFIANSNVIYDIKADLQGMIIEGQLVKINDYLNKPLWKKMVWAMLKILAPLL